MRIEGTIAQTFAVSDQMMTVDAAVSTQARERANLDVTRQQAMISPDAAVVSADERAVGPKLLSTAVGTIDQILSEMDEDVSLRLRKDAKGLVVRAIDRKTGKLMREIPESIFMEMLALGGSRVAGLLVDERQ